MGFIYAISDIYSRIDLLKEYYFISKKSTSDYEFVQYVSNRCRCYVLKNHRDLMSWLQNLSYYNESDYNQIFVHAWIFEPKSWKDYSTKDDFLLKS